MIDFFITFFFNYSVEKYLNLQSQAFRIWKTPKFPVQRHFFGNLFPLLQLLTFVTSYPHMIREVQGKFSKNIAKGFFSP